jgi:hypothetical protein
MDDRDDIDRRRRIIAEARANVERGRGSSLTRADESGIIHSQPIETITERAIESEPAAEVVLPDLIPEPWLDSIAEAMGTLTGDLRYDFTRAIDQLRKQVDQLEGRVDAMLRMSGGAAAKHVETTESGEMIHWRTVRDARR